MRTWSPDARLANLRHWLAYFTGPAVTAGSNGRSQPLTAAEACGFMSCMIVETGSLDQAQLDVIEAGSGRGRGAMQYTGAPRLAYDRARARADAQGIDTTSNEWQQRMAAAVFRRGVRGPARSDGGVADRLVAGLRGQQS